MRNREITIETEDLRIVFNEYSILTISSVRTVFAYIYQLVVIETVIIACINDKNVTFMDINVCVTTRES